MSRQRQQKMVPQDVVVRTTCDGCGRTVEGSPDDWLWFYSRHSDWGNDSCESSEYHDACSMPCFLRVLKEVVRDYGDGGVRPTLRIDVELDLDWALHLLALGDEH